MALLKDVIRQISVDAAARLLYCLDREDRPNVRLACREFRAFVDANVSSLTIQLKPGDRQRWLDGHTPSLSRWPLCSDLTVRVRRSNPSNGDDDAEADDTPPTASLLTLPFIGVPPEARRRITCMAVQVPLSSDTIVASIASRLPNLKSLDLSEAKLSSDQLQHQLLLEALGSLPHLKHLILPSYAPLECIGTLAGSSVKELEVGPHSQNPYLTEAAVAGISRLQGLTSLSLWRFPLGFSTQRWREKEHAVFLQMLDNLPTTMEGLELGQHVDYNEPSNYFHMKLKHAKLEELTVCGRDGMLVEFPALAEVLLASRVMGPKIARLQIEVAIIPSGMSVEEQQLQHWREILQRSEVVEVEEMNIQNGEVMEMIDLFGKPECLILVDKDTSMERLILKLRNPKESPTLVEAVELLQGGLQGAALPHHVGSTRGSCSSASSVCKAALQSMSANPSGGPHTMLLLQGPFVRMLVNGPEAVEGWLKGLEGQAAFLAMMPMLGRKIDFIASCLVVPDAFSIVLQCRAQEAVAIDGGAVSPAAAVAKAAVDAAAVGGGVGGGAALLQVLPVMQTGMSCKELFRYSVERELQGVWDARHSSGGGCRVGEGLVLMQLVEIWKYINHRSYCIDF